MGKLTIVWIYQDRTAAFYTE